MATHQWYYNKPGLVGDDAVGPLDQAEFVEQIVAGKVKPDWLISSPTATKGQWLALKDHAKLMEIRQRELDKRAANEEAARQAAAQQQAEEKSHRQMLKEAEAQRAAAEAQQRREEQETEQQKLAAWQSRQPPKEQPIAITSTIMALVAAVAILAGCAGLVDAETIMHETFAAICFVVALLCLVASLLAHIGLRLLWIGRVLIWREEREAERFNERRG